MLRGAGGVVMSAGGGGGGGGPWHGGAVHRTDPRKYWMPNNLCKVLSQGEIEMDR